MLAQELRNPIAADGMGVPPEKLPQMFELFAQGERSIARSEGVLVIGLTIVQKVVQRHGGGVSTQSPGPGMGRMFTVRLTAAQPAAFNFCASRLRSSNPDTAPAASWSTTTWIRQAGGSGS